MPLYLKKYQDNRKNGTQLFYMKAIHNAIIDENTIAEEIQAECSATISDVKGIIMSFIGEIRARAAEGKAIHIDGLGTFVIRITSSGSTSEEEYGIVNIKNAHLQFTPERHRKTNGKYDTTLTEGCTLKFVNGTSTAFLNVGNVAITAPYVSKSGVLQVGKGNSFLAVDKDNKFINAPTVGTFKEWHVWYPPTKEEKPIKLTTNPLPLSMLWNPQYASAKIECVMQ